ncbi:phosphatidylinositol/phosphatidylcholine transfer protein SFH11-like isoform X1 [Lycium ferocissimum]|uniref:phosphatidylinositol/phosphatidylcholine transfer protein SFH11-like isoform X1 n=1 Tax=Lycium ferocissimum TaxID=112874 RepID=UPI002815F2B3|nr:phosphatidylinositol/phosphatidylcholine transfer protein SFH11-like isoform X1 [Lycium ferocissimum]
MGDSFNPTPGTKSLVTTAVTTKNESKQHIISSGSNPFKNIRQIDLIKYGKQRRGSANQLVFFLVKVAALEAVRRISRSKCPFVWSSLQALQVVCYPPLKWMQRWNPFRVLVEGMQMLSRPLLVLSIATALSDHSEFNNDTSDSTQVSPDTNDTRADSESQLEVSSEQSIPSERVGNEVSQSVSSTSLASWLLKLYKDLEKQGICLPERIDEEELHQFFTAADGDFTRLLSSVKKTIRWRETYKILSRHELEVWSKMVFWHGFDQQHRPCLIVRLGLACTSLPSRDRPCFAQAVVSQVEHGVLHLVDQQNSQITVLVDCEGLTPLRLPMQMLRSCSTLLQDHFPNRLGCLFVIRLPPIVRVVAQTFVQIFKPVTRQKLRFEGEMYQKILAECLQTLPSYLGGQCTCSRCANLDMTQMPNTSMNDHQETAITEIINNPLDLTPLHSGEQTEIPTNYTCDQILRKGMLGILIFWVFVALIAGVFDPESRPVLPP